MLVLLSFQTFQPLPFKLIFNGFTSLCIYILLITSTGLLDTNVEGRENLTWKDNFSLFIDVDYLPHIQGCPMESHRQDSQDGRRFPLSSA